MRIQLLAASLAASISAAVAAQSVPAVDNADMTSADGYRAKQEIVRSTTQRQTRQLSGGGYHGPPAAAEAKGLSPLERQDVMAGVAASARDHYRPIMPALADSRAARVERPALGDPGFAQTIKEQQR